MSELSEHYRLLLSLDAAWQVDGVNLALEDHRVEIDVSHRGGTPGATVKNSISKVCHWLCQCRCGFIAETG